MKRLHLIILALFLLLGQLSGFDHFSHDHDHESGEVCDYCLSAQSLDHAVTVSSSLLVADHKPHWQSESVKSFIANNSIRFYAVRAPPRFI